MNSFRRAGARFHFRSSTIRFTLFPCRVQFLDQFISNLLLQFKAIPSPSRVSTLAADSTAPMSSSAVTIPPLCGFVHRLSLDIKIMSLRVSLLVARV